MKKISKKRQLMGEEEWKSYQQEKTRQKNIKYKKVNLEKVLTYKRNTKLQLINYKGGKCELCGYNKPIPPAFSFHHLDPSKKLFEISNSSKSFKAKKEEVDKCQLLCLNCHAEVHYLEDTEQLKILIKDALAKSDKAEICKISNQGSSP